MENFELLNSAAILFLDVLLTALLSWSLAKLGASTRLVSTVGLVAVVWLALLIGVFGGHHVIASDIGSPAFFAILVAGVAVVALMFFISPLGKVLGDGGQQWLLMLQGMRAFFGTAFLIQGVLGTMPGVFAVADGLTHITAAVLALWTAWMLGKGYVGTRMLWLTTLFGLLDIVVVAAGIAFMLLPRIGPYHSMMFAAFFAAPIFVAVHLLSIRCLLSSVGVHRKDRF